MLASVLRVLEVATRSLALGAPLLAQGSPTTKPATSRPELHAYRVSRPPVIDGNLDDEAWTHPPMETTQWLSYNPLNGDRIPQQTQVWVAYDDNYFYFAFKCDDPEPAGSKPPSPAATMCGTTIGSASASTRSAPASLRTT